MPGDLNTIVFNKAKSKKGKSVELYQVINCWSFVESMLRKSGAMTSNDYMTREELANPDADYQWGEISKIKTISAAKPGDIIQLNKYAVTCSVVKLPEKPGTYEYGDVPTMPHHSAIVHTALRNGKIKVMHQNWQGVKKVVMTDLIVKDGIYKEGELEVDCKVQGDITVYPPEKRF